VSWRFLGLGPAHAGRLSHSGGGRGGRSAHHQAGRHQNSALLFRVAGIFRLLAQRFKGGTRQVGTRQADGGERGSVNSAKSMSSRPTTDKS